MLAFLFKPYVRLVPNQTKEVRMKRYLFGLAMVVTLSLRAFDATIPILHLPNYYDEETHDVFMEKLEEAMCEVGFFALTGTDIDVEVLDQAYDCGAQFFAQSLDEKEKYHLLNGQRGYIPGESAKGSKMMDHKEFFNVGRDYSDEQMERLGYADFQKNVWPETPTDMEVSMKALRSELDKCTTYLDEMFSLVLEQPKDFLSHISVEGDVLMRMIHYPKGTPKGTHWASAHTDINMYTILPRSTAKGLQVFNNKEWIDVIVPDGAIIVNVADQLESMSNGRFKSSLHRVVDPGEGKERYSVVHFVHAAPTDRVGPLPEMVAKTGGEAKYADLTQKELLYERLIELRLLTSKEQMQIFVDSGAIEKLKAVDRFSPEAEAVLIENGLL